MSSRLQVTLMAVVLFLVPASASAAEEVSVLEILELAAELGGEEVTVEGELVGDYGFRGDGWTWAQLNGDAYVFQPIREGGLPFGANVGIGIRVPAELADGLDPPGGYRNRGPVVRVTGIWKYHDPERQGESYLQVESLSVREPGRQFDEDANWSAFILGVVLLAAASFVAYLPRREGRKRRARPPS
ncbi:MAG: hypothetical protein ACRDVL_08860 [Acidimicrobiia bacterium]